MPNIWFYQLLNGRLLQPPMNDLIHKKNDKFPDYRLLTADC
jgi:hypothetical protein